jgi:L-alanine-DL-glutamate epimerase-like enolase superfamily enzyme
MKRPEQKIERVTVTAYRIPTDYPESDGTLEWNSTTLVVVEAEAGGKAGLGYTYADTATARLIADLLARVVEEGDALDVTANWSAMLAAVRNLGRAGIASMAIAAVDSALWDLKARILGLPLVIYSLAYVAEFLFMAAVALRHMTSSGWSGSSRIGPPRVFAG